MNSGKLEAWLSRCHWLQTTVLDDNTRRRLDKLIADLERDIEDQKDFDNRQGIRAFSL